MIKVIVFDLSYTLLFPREHGYKGELNQLHVDLKKRSEYDFSKYFQLDKKTMEYVKTLKGKFRLFIYTSGYIQEADEIKTELESVFERVISASDLGVSKKDPEGYRLLAEKLKIIPEESLFIDNTEDNCLSAEAAGFRTIVFRGLDDIKRRLREL